MGQIARKYDFKAGTSAKSGQVDEELSQLVDAHNSLADTTAGRSGAEFIGSPAITGVVGDSVYEQLVSIEAQVQDAVGSIVPPGTVTTAMIQNLAVTEQKLDVAAAKKLNDAFNSVNALDSLYRQAIINGNFDIWQRYTSLPALGGSYGPDRWSFFRVGYVAGLSISRQLAGLDGSLYCARVQRDNGNASAGQIWIAQALESSESVKFKNKKVTLSFWARSGANFSAAQSALIAQVVTGTGTDQGPSSSITGKVFQIDQSVALGNGWTKYTVATAIPLPADMNQLFIMFTYNPSGVAGAADYFEIAQVQINAGDVGLPFQPRSIADELRYCKRYLQSVAEPGVPFRIGFVNANTYPLLLSLVLGIEMRISPTCVVLNTSTGATIPITSALKGTHIQYFGDDASATVDNANWDELSVYIQELKSARQYMLRAHRPGSTTPILNWQMLAPYKLMLESEM